MSLALGRTEKSVTTKVCSLKRKRLMSRVGKSHNIRLLKVEDSKTLLAY